MMKPGEKYTLPSGEKIEVAIALAAPMLQQLAWCERQAKKVDVTIAGKVSNLTFHAESLERLIRQFAAQADQKGVEKNLVDSSKTSLKTTFDHITRLSLNVLQTMSKEVEKCRGAPSLHAASCIEEDKAPEAAALAKLNKTAAAKAFAKAYRQLETQIGAHDTWMDILTKNVATSRLIDITIPDDVVKFAANLKKDGLVAAKQLLAELAVIQGLFADIPAKSTRLVLLEAAQRRVSELGAKLTPKLEIMFNSKLDEESAE